MQQSSTKNVSQGTVTYFICNRSGNPRSHSPNASETGTENSSLVTRKRQCEPMGSNKCGSFCVAHMKATVTASKEEVTVEYCSTHTGHSLQLAHIPIPTTVKQEIASKLHAGVTVDRILDDIRSNIERGLKREHLVTKLDIRNIKMKLNLDAIIKHQNDADSVRVWIKQLEKLAYNPVLMVKFQGEEQGEHMDNLGNDDFLLVIQTEFQKDIMIKYGNNVVLLDSTHGLTQHNFKLITVMMIDEHEEGVPVAFAISNREDTSLLIQYFKALHNQVET